VIVSTARMEGGPMSVVEAIALGNPVLSRAGVGLVDDYPGVIAYSDDNDLIDKLQSIHQARSFSTEQIYGWDVWAAKHYEVFASVAGASIDVTRRHNAPPQAGTVTVSAKRMKRGEIQECLAYLESKGVRGILTIRDGAQIDLDALAGVPLIARNKMLREKLEAIKC